MLYINITGEDGTLLQRIALEDFACDPAKTAAYIRQVIEREFETEE